MMRRVVLVAVAVGVIGFIAISWPDFSRYMKLRRM
jgi:hypothetical protein